MTAWLLEKLLDAGLIDGVLHAGSADGGSGSLFRYAVSHWAADLRARRNSIYYSTEMSEALSSIAGDGKRYACVGGPCFVKAMRLLLRQDARLAVKTRSSQRREGKEVGR